MLCLSLLLSVSLVVQWVDVTRLEKNATLLFPESIRVDTRDQELFFSMFLNIGETFKLMEQLANLAMRQLLDSEGFLEDKALPRPVRPHKNISALKRYATLPRNGEIPQQREWLPWARSTNPARCPAHVLPGPLLWKEATDRP